MKRILLSLFIIIGMAGAMVCQDTEQLQPPFVVDNFKGGLNVDTASNLLPNEVSPDLNNVVLDETDAMTKRLGLKLAFTLPVSSNTQILNAFSAVYEDGSSEFIVHAGSEIFSTDGYNTWRLIVGGVSSKEMMQFAMFNGEVWMTNGVDNVGIWNKQTYTTYSFIPRGRYIIVDKEQVIMAGMFEDPSAVRFSNLLKESKSYATGKEEIDWPAANQLPCGYGDGQIITGLFKIQNKVYATKNKSIYGLLTSDDYKDASVFLYTTLYGAASQRSISGYKDFKIMLDNNGLEAYNGGEGCETISKDLDNITNKIGLINTNYGRWTLTSNSDFSTGTFTNCWNNTGTVQVSTYSKTWATYADYSPAFTGSTQEIIDGNTVKITTTAGSVGYTKIPITWNESAGNWNNFGGTAGSFGANNGDKGYWTDNDEDTWAAPVFWDTQFQWMNFAPVSGLTMRIKKITMKYQRAIFDNSSYQQLLTPGYSSGTDTIYDTLRIDTYKSDYSARNNPFVQSWVINTGIQNVEIIIPDSVYNAPTIGYPEKIQIGLKPVNYRYRLDGVASRGYTAMLLYDISVYTLTSGPSYRYATATYISPIFDSGQVTTQYQFFKPSHSLGITPSAGTIGYTVRSDDNSDMSSPSAWYGLGTSSATDTAIDGQRYFQFKAGLATSSNTFTPTLFNATLTYAPTGYAVYTSKVFNAGTLTSWGSFMASGEGSVSYYVRASSKSYDKDVAVLSESGANQWTSIGNGDNLSSVITSPANCYIQLRGAMTTSNATIESMTVSWFWGGATTGGVQDVASINYKGKYYIAYSTWAGYNTDVLVFDKNQKFTRYNWAVAGFVEFKNQLYVLSSTSPIVLEAFSGTTDAGSTINMFWRSPDYDFGFPDITKEYKYIYITGKKQPGSFAHLDTYVDFSTYPVKSLYCDLSVDSNSRLQLSDECYGKNIAVVVRSTATACEIQRINVYWRTKPLR